MVRRACSAGDDVVDGVAGVQPEDTDLGDAIVYIYVDNDDADRAQMSDSVLVYK